MNGPTEVASVSNWNKRSLDPDHPSYIGAYGPIATARPRFNFLGSSGGFIRSLQEGCANMVWRGLHFSCNDTVQVAPGGETGALQFLQASDGAIKNTVIEDVFFDRCWLGFAPQEDRVDRNLSNITVRRCVWEDCYSSACLISKYHTLLWEENIAIRCGLRYSAANPGDGDDGPGLDAQCWYFQDGGVDDDGSSEAGNGLTVRGCIGADLSSTWVQMRAGGRCEHNFTYRVPMPIGSVSRYDTHDVAEQDLAIVKGNVCVESNNMPSGRGARGWFLDLAAPGVSSLIEDNIAVRCIGTNEDGIAVGRSKGTTIRRNITYDFVRGLSMFRAVDDVTIEDNVFYTPDEGLNADEEFKAIVNYVEPPFGEFDPAGYTFSGNGYYKPWPQNRWFRNGPSGYLDDVAAWAAYSGETGAYAITTDPWVRGGGYAMSDAITALALPGIANAEQWMDALADQREGNWRDDIMAVPMCNWWRTGFGLDATTIDHTAATPAPVWDPIQPVRAVPGTPVVLDLDDFVTQAGGLSVTYRAGTVLPSFVTLDRALGTLTIAPTEADRRDADYPIFITALNNGNPPTFADVYISITVPYGAGFLRRSVITGEDDGDWLPSANRFRHTNILEVHSSTNQNDRRKAWARIDRVHIDNTLTYSDAALLLRPIDETVNNVPNITIWGVLGKSPRIPYTGAELDALPLTTASVDWVVPDGAPRQVQKSPSIIPILQEITAQPTHVSGDPIMFMLRGRNTNFSRLQLSRKGSGYPVSLLVQHDGDGVVSPPSWSTLPNFEVVKGTTAVIDLSGYADSSNPLTFVAAEGWPSWGSLSSSGVATFVVSAGQGAGPYDMQLFVVDESTPQSVAWTSIKITAVDGEASNLPPTWGTIPNTSVEVAEEATIALADFVVDPEGGVISYQAVGTWPAFVALNTSTGLVTVSPQLGDEESSPYTLTVQATDNGSPQESSNSNFTVIVTNTPEPEPDPELPIPVAYRKTTSSFILLGGN